jgi:plasmid replication initiation protein
MFTNKLVYESNLLIESTHKIHTTSEFHIIFCALGLLDQTKRIERGDVVSVNVEDYARLHDITKKHAYEILSEAAEKLQRRVLTIYPENGKKKKLTVNWFHSILHNPDTQSLDIIWHDEVVPYISAIEPPFTRHYLNVTRQMKSMYSIRLYRLFSKEILQKKMEFNVEEFRRLMDVEDMYEGLDDLKKRVIVPAVEEINRILKVEMEFKVAKLGRKVVGFVFSWKRVPVNKERKEKREMRKWVKGLKFSEDEDG